MLPNWSVHDYPKALAYLSRLVIPFGHPRLSLATLCGHFRLPTSFITQMPFFVVLAFLVSTNKLS